MKDFNLRITKVHKIFLLIFVIVIACACGKGDNESGTNNNNETGTTNNLEGTWNFYFTPQGVEEHNYGPQIVLQDGDKLLVTPKEAGSEGFHLKVMDKTVESYWGVGTNSDGRYEGVISDDYKTISGTYDSVNTWRMEWVSGATELIYNCNMTLQGNVFGENINVSGNAGARKAIEGQGLENISFSILYDNDWLNINIFSPELLVTGKTLDVQADGLDVRLEGFLVWENKVPNGENPIDEEYDEIKASSGTFTIETYTDNTLKASFNLTFPGNYNISGTIDATGFVIDLIE